MIHLDLFSGIGGFALAARWVWGEAHKVVAFVEIDEFCRKVIRKNFGHDANIHSDIRDFDATPLRGTIDLCTGGFPCQPYSTAGKRRGKADVRSLWHEMFRVVAEARPRWIIGENVAGFVKMELDDCLSDLESEGYGVQAFVIPACAANAPHRRDRVWIVAYDERGLQLRAQAEVRTGRNAFDACGQDAADANGQWQSQPQRIIAESRGRAGNGDKEFNTDSESVGLAGHSSFGESAPVKDRPVFNRSSAIVPDAACCGQQKQRESIKTKAQFAGTWFRDWREIEPTICRSDDALSRRMDTARLKALGNAIVPTVAYEIMRHIAILEYERSRTG